MPLHKLKKIQLQERFTLMTHDSIGHLKRFYMSLFMSILSLSGGVWVWMEMLEILSVLVWIQL